MKGYLKIYLLYILALSLVLTFILSGCSTKEQSARDLLDKYFTSAMKQDYAITYTCYYSDYQNKVSKEEFIQNRQVASVVQSYKILSLDLQNDNGQATVEITFAPSEKLNRSEPATVKVQENLIKEKDGWKIKVWE